ncbi:MAG TPA: phosphoenolpyruvate carboxykinase (ATP) [Candidatus Krumholzibacterium sp.]|nr:phosphoenolpyruvate carboxykinase (ATP) [Candidatus Krumholzibacterium sp.]
MVKAERTLALELVDRIMSAAAGAGALVSDRKKISDSALKDATTLDARPVRDALNVFGSPSFMTRKTSRSAAFTEIFFGQPDRRQAGILEAAADFLVDMAGSGGELLVMDKLMGLHPEHSHHCRTIVTPGYARMLVMWDKLIFDLPPDRIGDDPEQVEILIPEWGEYARKRGLPEVAILVDATSKVTFALGSDYFGEIKKGHLRMAMYQEKLDYKEGRGGGLGIHAGGKVIRAKDASTGDLREYGALFFGLSGTGKTTLSVHHFWLDAGEGEGVIIRQDDFFVLGGGAEAFGTEDNAYIKTEGLEPEGQPLLYKGAISPHSVLENVYIDPVTLEPDFDRYDHPWVPGGECRNGRGIAIRREMDFTDDRIDLDRVDMIFFITRRETVIPPVMKLDTEQAAAAFMLGESILTSAADPTKAGQSVREVGTNPFIVGSGGEEGNIFYEILKKNPHVQCYLFNTGGFGGRSVQAGEEDLSSPGAMDRLKAYLSGAVGGNKGGSIGIELRDGTTEEFKVERVRYELMEGERRFGSREDLLRICESIEKEGRPAGDYRLIRIDVLAGRKIRIQDSAAFIREIARGTVEWKRDGYWGCLVPASVPGVDLARFDEHRYYSDEEIVEMKDTIRRERVDWLHSFEDLDPGIGRIFDR